MNVGVTSNAASDLAYRKTQTEAAQAEKKTAAALGAKDEITVSQAAKEFSKKPDSSLKTVFTSFADEFSKVTNEYADTIREHYAKEHAENLTYDNPSLHIWDKYKNAESPDFRSDMSEDERAWAYDQELDMLSGGKHLQMGNPYAFPAAGGPPSLASAAMKALAAARNQIDQSVQTLLAENGIDLADDTSFRLTVEQPGYSIKVSGLEDDALAEAIEQALNSGDNGKNLYNHLKLTGSDSVEYVNGHLAALDAQQELTDSTLAEIKKQAGPIWARYSSTYNPHQKAMNEKILSLNPDSPLNTQERMDRMSAAVRVGAPELIAEFRTRQNDLSLVINENRAVDPDGSIALQTYLRAYAQPAIDARKTIAEFYADAHKENSSYPFVQGLEHIAQKYKRFDSAIFRADLSQEQRDMFYRQERALLTGARLTLFDPYALASVGGVQNAQTSHQIALQAVQDKMNELLSNLS